MRRFLIFDSKCTRCSTIADEIQQLAVGKLVPLSIYDRDAQSMLDQAYPNGWIHAPYLIEKNGEQYKAWTGFGGAARLGLIVGPVKSLQIWRLAWRTGIITKRLEASTDPNGISRRLFLKLTGTLVAATAAASSINNVMAQSNWCEPCGGIEGSNCNCYNQTIFPCGHICSPYTYDQLVTWDCYWNSGAWCTRHGELDCGGC